MIIVRLQGGLGNQMFQYALGRVLSLKNNTELLLNIQAYEDKTLRPFKKSFVTRDYALGIFNIHARIAKDNEIPLLFRMYGKGKLMLIIDALRRRIFRHVGHELFFKKFNSKLLELKNPIYLDGFFQSYKYFRGYEDVIRKEFTLVDDIPDHVKNLKKEILESESMCIFVRRNDFIGNSYYEVVDKTYYFNSVSFIRGTFTISKIFIFSDDIEWCKNNLNFDIDTMFVDNTYTGDHFGHHMLLMSCCKYFIIPNSTFSWWGAWLSERKDKVVVIPSRWVGDNSVDIHDVAPSEWIKM